MIQKKDIDSRFVRQIDQAIADVESIKEQINTLNQNDNTIEGNVNKSLEVVKKQIIEAVNTIANSLNGLIDKDKEDMTGIYEEIAKIFKLIEIKEKEYKSLFGKVDEKLNNFIKNFESIEGYFKQEGGKLKGVDLPEDRIFNDKFHVQTVTEIIREQPIINEIYH